MMRRLKSGSLERQSSAEYCYLGQPGSSEFSGKVYASLSEQNLTWMTSRSNGKAKS